MDKLSEVELAVLELTRQLRLLRWEVNGMRIERHQLTLLAGGGELLALDSIRPDANYQVSVELNGCRGGNAGDFIISDKLRNGFRLNYSGDAEQAEVTVFVRG